MKIKLFCAILFLLCAVHNTKAQKSDNEKNARDYIKSQEKILEINPDHSFKLRFVRKGLAGETLRFQHMLRDVPVFDSEIVVNFSSNNTVAYSSNSYDKSVQNIVTTPTITENQAIELSKKELKINPNTLVQECKLFVYNKVQPTRLVYRTLTSNDLKSGNWEVIVDAKTSEIISSKDIAFYYNDNEKKQSKKKQSKKNEKKDIKSDVSFAPNAFVPGTAMVFLSDPLSFGAVAYGGQYVDGSDATNATLNAARASVVLPEIEVVGSTYKLKSSYVEIKDFEAPSKGLFTQNTSNFSFTRDNDGFEAANVFYHLDNNLRYINETLGVTCRPFLNGGILWFDPSAVNGADNSYYTGGTNSLAFGEGCVDDGEDGDVIWHELGHGLHDWLTGGSLSQVNGLSEGCGDYWAQSNSRGLNQWSSSAPAYQWMFNWDGHNVCWGGRTTNYTAIYPAGLNGSIHSNGQIWATVLMKIWDVIGRQKTDKAFLEGLALTNSSTNQQNAAIAVRQAAINMNYSCVDIQTMTTKFAAAGYTMPAVALAINCPATQNVTVGGSGTYSVPSFSGLSNAISSNCSATITQSPAIGTNLTPGTYPVTMTAANGTQASCNFSLVVSGSLATNEFNKIKDFRMYPNPASGVLNLSGEFDANESISVFNLLGQKVLDKDLLSNQEKLDVSKLPNGVYTIYFNVSKSTEKFIKQ